MQESIRILLIENEEQDAKTLMKYLLEEGESRYQIAHVTTLTQALERMSEESFDLSLMNLLLPDSGGVYGLKKIIEKNGEMPVIVVNGPNDDNLFESSILNGAQDYLGKGSIGTQSLNRSVCSSVLRFKFLREKTRAEAKDSKSSQISSVAEMAKDVATNLDNPLKSMKSVLNDFRGVTGHPESLSPAEVKKLLTEIEDISDEFSTIASDLKHFWKEVASDPLFKSKDRSRFRILCVDDEAEILEIMVDALNASGYSDVETASTGMEAYNKAVISLNKGERYDLMISDWKMPRMTGLELLEKVRHNQLLYDTPFVMLTALDDRTNIQQAAKAKVSDYIIKPFQREALPKRIDRLRLLSRRS